MTNKQLSAYTNLDMQSTKKLFNPIREAFEELNLGDITIHIADLYLTASTPPNHDYYLRQLGARKLVAEQGGFKMNVAEQIVKGGNYDPWVMLFSAAKYYLEEEVPEEFHNLVIKPVDDLLKIEEEAKEKKNVAIAKAKKTITTISSPLSKVSGELENIEAGIMAGTEVESIRHSINNLIDRINRMEG